MIFIAGFHASGKTTLAELLVERFDFLHIETSVIVRDFKELDDPLTPMIEWARAKEDAYGQDFFDHVIVQEATARYQAEIERGHIAQDIVITGNRSLHGIQYAAEHLKGLQIGPERPAHMLAVSNDPDVLYDRFRERNRRPGDSEISKEAFLAMLKHESDSGLVDIFDHADHTLHNYGDHADFIDKAERLFIEILGLTPQNEGEQTVPVGERDAPRSLRGIEL